MDQLSTIADAMACGWADWMGIWGDPWLSGTILVCSYFGTGVVVYRVSCGLAGRERGFWRLCSAVLCFQAANTPLDLHALVWTTGRCMAHAQGWYESRKAVQIGFLLTTALLALIIGALAIKRFSAPLRHNLLLTMGLVISLGFTLIKGVSLHGLAAIYGQRLGPFFVADVIEWSGIALAFAGAVRRQQMLTAQSHEPPLQ